MKFGFLAAAIAAGTVGAWSPAALAFSDGAFWDGFYAKVYGGVTFENELNNESDGPPAIYEVEQGMIMGASVGIATGIEGLSFELDGAYTSASYEGYENTFAAFSLMGNLVFEAELADRVSVYAGLGVGIVSLSYEETDPAWDATGSGAGGQVFAGADFGLTDNLSIFGEVRYQTAFGDIEVTDTIGPYDVGYSSTSVLVGLKLAM